jgi:hypothetical protein
MPTLRVMTSGGDRRISWDAEAALRGDPEAQAAVREAERIFAQERARGSIAFRVRPGTAAERLHAFDAQCEDTIVIPPVAGG